MYFKFFFGLSAGMSSILFTIPSESFSHFVLDPGGNVSHFVLDPCGNVNSFVLDPGGNVSSFVLDPDRNVSSCFRSRRECKLFCFRSRWECKLFCFRSRRECKLVCFRSGRECIPSCICALQPWPGFYFRVGSNCPHQQVQDCFISATGWKCLGSIVELLAKYVWCMCVRVYAHYWLM